MKTRTFVVVALAVSLILISTWALTGGVTAQAPTPLLDQPARKPFPQSGDLSIQADAQGIPLGQPGLSFRYVRTFGETLVPYLADNDHLFAPEGVAVDAAGNVYITEHAGQRMMKFTATGVFSMSIGQAGVFLANNENRLGWPDHLAVDRDGNIWVVEGTNRISKWSSTGTYVSQLGETWSSGSDNDHFSRPYGIAFDDAGRAYVGDTDNHRIQIFDSAGVYSATLGTTGTCGAANDQFCSPRGLAVDSAGRIYVADTDNHRVQIYDAGLNYLATLGTTGVCGAANDRFCSPHDVDIGADGKIYVADTGNNRVLIFTVYPVLSYEATLGVTGEEGSDSSHFSMPTSVAVDNSGNIYVADDSNDRVQMFNSNRVYVRTFGVTDVPYLTDALHFYSPTDAAVDPDGNVLIVEGEGQRLVKLDADGVPQFTIGSPGNPGGAQDRFCGPGGVATDSAGRIYVADSCNNRIQIYASDGAYYATLGTGHGTGIGQFKGPQGVAVGADGYIYVADTYNHRIQVYDGDRSYVTTLGETGMPGSDNAHFNSPEGVAVDQAGNIYVVDTDNLRVQKCDLRGACTTFAGVAGERGEDFGHFGVPHDVAVDTAGRVYVVDEQNRRVQVFDESGAYLTTIGGSYGQGNGQNTGPVGVEVDAIGNVYIADQGSHRVQKFAPGMPSWVQSNINGFGDRQNQGVPSLAPFDGRLYAGVFNAAAGAQLWRRNGNGDWTAIITDGFGDPANLGIFHLMPFSGQLYAGTWNYDPGENRTDGGEVWRSEDGTTWTQVVDAGFGTPSNGAVFHFGVFKDHLYAGTVSFTDTDGAEIWRSITGDSDSWERVVENGLGNPDNMGVRTFEVFSNTLFAGISNYTDGAEVWRSADGLSWTSVMTGGFGSAERVSVPALAVFRDHLYASTSGGAGAQVWRCQVCDGSDWEKVVADGFGNSDNRQASALTVFDTRLYFVIGNSASGLEVWHTADGVNWEQLVIGGFGDSNNAFTGWDNAVAVFNNSLYIGSWNDANGGEVWQRLHEVFLPLVMRSD